MTKKLKAWLIVLIILLLPLKIFTFSLSKVYANWIDDADIKMRYDQPTDSIMVKIIPPPYPDVKIAFRLTTDLNQVTQNDLANIVIAPPPTVYSGTEIINGENIFTLETIDSIPDGYIYKIVQIDDSGNYKLEDSMIPNDGQKMYNLAVFLVNTETNILTRLTSQGQLNYSSDDSDQPPPPGSDDDIKNKLANVNKLFQEWRDLITGNDDSNDNAPVLGGKVNAFLLPESMTFDEPPQPNPFWKEQGGIWDQLKQNLLSSVLNAAAGALGLPEAFNSDELMNKYKLTDLGETRLNDIKAKAQELNLAAQAIDNLNITQAQYDNTKILKRFWNFRLDKPTEVFSSWAEFKTHLEKMSSLYDKAVEDFTDTPDQCESKFLTGSRDLPGFMICVAANFIDKIATFLMERGINWIKAGVGL